MSKTVTYSLQYQPDRVPVSDDRGLVAGARVTVSSAEHRSKSGTFLVIPQEGPSPDCWLGRAKDLPSDIWDELDQVARAGARGESGIMVVEFEEEFELVKEVNGLSFEQWLGAAAREPSCELCSAWLAGEDPGDYEITRTA